MPERNVWNGVPTANQYTQQDQNTQMDFVINDSVLQGSTYEWKPKSSLDKPVKVKESTLVKDFEPEIPEMQKVAYPVRPSTGPKPSKNVFFTRNNPHSLKVRHIRGLNNTPICTVFNARHREKALMDIHAVQAGERLASFMPKKPLTNVALGNLPRGEKAIPGIGMIQMVPKWLSTLRDLTKEAGLRQTINSPMRTQSEGDVQLVRPQTQPKSSRAAQRKMENEFVRRTVSQNSVRVSQQGDRPATSQHSLRLPDINEKNGIGSASGRRLPLEDRTNGFADGRPAPIPFPDSETFVFHMLGSLLDTENVDDIKQWLSTSPENERERVLNIIRRLTEDDLQFRDGMDPMYGHQGGEYRDTLLQHDGSIDRDAINKFNTEKRKRDEEIRRKMKEDVANYEPPLIRDMFDQNVTRDIENGSRQSQRAKENAIAEVSNLLVAPVQDAEVEGIRSLIASREKFNVFDTKNVGFRDSPKVC